MNRRVLQFILVGLIAWTAVSVRAQTQRAWNEESRTLELVDRLKDVIRRAENNRNADPWLLDQLRDLVRRYDWPWRVRLLYDDFGDGDYTADPVWIVSRGDFRVTRGSGLMTSVSLQGNAQERLPEKKSETTAIDILGGILKGMTESSEGAGEPPRTEPSTAEIHTELPISNAFAVKIRMTSRGRREGGSRIEFGPYQGKEREWGYRLAYYPGQKPSFELLRVSPGRSAVVELYGSTVDLEDGRIHDLEWRRDREGSMIVALDDKEIIRTMDRGSTDRFDGFTVLNGGGEFAFDRMEIYGTEN